MNSNPFANLDNQSPLTKYGLYLNQFNTISVGERWNNFVPKKYFNKNLEVNQGDIFLGTLIDAHGVRTTFTIESPTSISFRANFDQVQRNAYPPEHFGEPADDGTLNDGILCMKLASKMENIQQKNGVDPLPAPIKLNLGSPPNIRDERRRAALKRKNAFIFNETMALNAAEELEEEPPRKLRRLNLN